jgi:Ca2+-binding RTX toxin-like protein
MTTATATVQTRVLRTASGPPLAAGDLVWVWYEGRLLDGTLFDANYSFSSFSAIPQRTEFRFRLGVGEVIRGWDQALANRRLGEVLELTIPAELAYGSRGSGSLIPPDAPLRFKVEILARFGQGDSRVTGVTFADLGVDTGGFQQQLGRVEDFKVGLDSGDEIIGGPLADLLLGLRGNDRLRGAIGADILAGGIGNDELEGGQGDDIVDGGAGLDTAVFGAANNTVRLASGGPQATGEGNDTLIAIENVNGGAGNDRISGNASRNTLDGGLGRDLLTGDGAQDRLTGGAAADTFVYARVSDSLAGRSTRDIITDFNGVAGDRINLSGLDAWTAVEGRQRFRFIAAKPFSGNSGEVRFSNGLLQINTDADSLSEMEIALPGVATVLAQHLIL